MKKVLYILASMALFSTITFADEQLLNMDLSQLPTDDEIMQAMEKYNFTPEQKQQVFEEAKKQLEQFQQIQADQNIQQIENIQPQKRYSSHPPLTRRSNR